MPRALRTGGLIALAIAIPVVVASATYAIGVRSLTPATRLQVNVARVSSETPSPQQTSEDHGGSKAGQGGADDHGGSSTGTGGSGSTSGGSTDRNGGSSGSDDGGTSGSGSGSSGSGSGSSGSDSHGGGGGGDD